VRLKFSVIKGHRMVEWISGLAGENNSGFAEALATGKHTGQNWICFFVRGAVDTMLNSGAVRDWTIGWGIEDPT
jgi:hypothetical protein